jgi:hypothetical protein
VSGKSKPLAGPTTTPSTTVPTTPTTTVSTTPTTTPVPSSTIATLLDQLPDDVNVDECVTAASFTGSTGIIDSYDCNLPTSSSLSGAHFIAYQTRDTTSFNTSWKAYNKSLRVSSSDQHSHSCPAAHAGFGITTWFNDSDPSKKLGVLECYQAEKGGYVYLWSDTHNHSFFLVHGATTKQNGSVVDKWWKNHA